MENNVVIMERTYHAPVAKVWYALTDKDAMKQWYFDLAEFKPEVGFEFSFAGKGAKGENYIHHCKILEVIPERKLTYTWTYQDHEGYSEVTFELFPEGDTTRIKLTHEGLASFPTTSPDFARESFLKGWTWLIGTGLKEFVEK